MILEVAILNLKPGSHKEFERKFKEAEKLIQAASGYLSHQLKKCVENESRYLLLVNWRSIEDHEVGFRGSKDYQKWKQLLHHFYEPFPVVEHYK